jgi:DNA-directed RNA polymerase specialized sigma24 family protein
MGRESMPKPALTIEDLRNLRDLHSQINSLKGRIERLRGLLSSPASVRLSYAPRGSGTHSDPVGNGVVKLAEMEEELQQRIVELEEKIRRIEGEINALPPRERAVIRARYVDGLDWRQVARRASYTSEHCRKINAMACRKLDTK